MQERQPAETWYVIANPAAGNGKVRRRWSSLAPWLERNLDAPVIELTRCRGHATDLAREAVGRGYRRLLAVGGDGTCNEIINGIFGEEGIPAADLTLALAPVGTGNDWMRTHGIPRLGKRWLEMLHNGKTFRQDVGRIDFTDPEGRPAKRFFLNVAGLAFDAFVVQQISHDGRRRPSAGFYLLLLLRHLLRYTPQPALVEMDGRQFRDSFFTIEVGIGRYAGGGMEVAPHAVPDDGRLALTLARNTSRADILINLRRFYDGSIGQHAKVDPHQAAA